MMRNISLLVALLATVASVGAFAPSSLSTGRGTIATDLYRPPTAFVGSSSHRHTALSMTILDRFRRKGKDDDGGVAVLEKEATSSITGSEDDDTCIAPEDVVEKSETEKLMEQVKEAGLAGVISYAFWEIGFWAVSVPVCVVGYRELTGHWPDFSNSEDMQKLGAEAFAFVNFARFAVPLRIGLALGTTPWVDKNIVQRFFMKEEPPICEPEDEAANGDAN